MHERARVTLRIETAAGERSTTIRLIGRILSEDLDALRAQLEVISANIVLDLGEVSLANLEVIRFLCTCESQGIQLVNCPAYIRKWIDRERQD